MRLGRRCHDRIYRVDRSDEFDVTLFGFFLNSSLAPVLRFRRSFVSVCNVLKGIKRHGFSERQACCLGAPLACCSSYRVLQVLLPPLSLGAAGYHLTFMVSTTGPWIV